MLIDFKKNETNGFTILEILVVMVIIGSLLFFLVQSISTFRRNIELTQSAEQIMGIITQTTNLAGNNVIPIEVVPSGDFKYAYLLTAKTNQITRQFCSRSDDDWICGSEENMLPNYLASLSLESTCEGILFSNLSGDFLIKNNSIYSTDGICELEVSHMDDPENVFRKITFNATKNSYEIDFPE